LVGLSSRVESLESTPRKIPRRPQT
jgi:hypothetical protein